MMSGTFAATTENALGEMLSAISSLPRPLLARLIEKAIDHLDEMDPDPDQEEDDPVGQCDEDGVNTNSMEGSAARGSHDLDNELVPDWGIDQTNCLPYGMVIASDRDASRPHRDRIRRTRCISHYRRWRDYRTGQERREVYGHSLIVPPIAPEP